MNTPSFQEDHISQVPARRVLELAEALLSKLATVTTSHPITVAVAKVIQSRCERKIPGFKA